MRTARRLARWTLLTLLALLALSGTAAADCAWVLWSQYTGDPHEVLGAFADQAACDAEALWARNLEKTVQEKAAAVNADKSIPPTRMPNGKILGPITAPPQTFICLPDTVDPRGPKAR